MYVTNEYEIDLSCSPSEREIPEIQAYQGEGLSRKVEFTLKDGDTGWLIPSNVVCMIRFVKPDGHGGAYSVLPDNTNAWSVVGNKIVIVLVPQMFDVAGLVEAEAALYWDNKSLTVTNVRIIVDRNPHITEEVTSDYYNYQNLEQINSALAKLVAGLNDITPGKIGAKAANTIEPIATGGTGAHTAELAMSNLSELHFNGDWQAAKPGISTWHYEVDDTEEMRTQYNIPHGGCEILVMKRANGRGIALAFGWVSGQYQMWRNNLHDDTNSNEWASWVDVRDAIDAAPAGYGLGTIGTEIQDCNSAISSGFYKWEDGCLNSPFNYGTMVSIGRFHGYPHCNQISICNAGIEKGCIAVRGNNGEWGVWEYVNPNMTVGAEYRTTERLDGKPVYAMTIDFGALPNDSSGWLAAPFSATSIVRASGMGVYGGLTNIPCRWLDSGIVKEIGLTVTNMGISVFTNFDASHMRIYIQVWYTKN